MQERQGRHSNAARSKTRVAAFNQQAWGKMFFSSLLPMLICWTWLLWPMPGATQASTVEALESSDCKRIEGYWRRLDGGYILQLQDVKEDGSLNAAYFNPQPINVSRAEARRKEGTVTLFVELRDINYPGSTYTLDYDSTTDQFMGVYFHAVSKQSFQIEFVRMK